MAVPYIKPGHGSYCEGRCVMRVRERKYCNKAPGHVTVHSEDRDSVHPGGAGKCEAVGVYRTNIGTQIWGCNSNLSGIANRRTNEGILCKSTKSVFQRKGMNFRGAQAELFVASSSISSNTCFNLRWSAFICLIRYMLVYGWCTFR